MAEKLSKKEIEQPDWFHTEFTRIGEFISRRRIQVAWIAGIVAFCLIASSGWYLYRINYEKKAGQLYAQARSAAYANVPAGREKNAIKLYESVIAKYPGSRAAVTAYYRLGNLYFNLGEIDRSAGAYGEFIKRSPKNSDLVALAYMSLGYCHEAKGDLLKALASFRDAIGAKGGKFFEAVAYRDMARICEEMKEPGKAVEYYRKALEKSSDPAMNLLLKRKIATLG